jgi:hypothetical protein
MAGCTRMYHYEAGISRMWEAVFFDCGRLHASVNTYEHVSTSYLAMAQHLSPAKLVDLAQHTEVHWPWRSSESCSAFTAESLAATKGKRNGEKDGAWWSMTNMTTIQRWGSFWRFYAFLTISANAGNCQNIYKSTLTSDSHNCHKHR